MAWINADQFARDMGGLRDVCAGCGHTKTRKNPLTLSDDGYRIHVSHINDPNSGYYRRAQH